MDGSSSCSTLLPAFDFVKVLDLGYLNNCVVVSNCYFCFYFPDDIEYEVFYSMLIFHMYIFLGEMSFALKQVVSLYDLDNSPLPDIFCKHFLLVCGFIPLRLFFAQ